MTYRSGEQFIAQWDQIKTGANRQQNRMAIAVERELQQIFGFAKLEINAAPGNETLQIIADDQPYELQEQGAGLAQFVVVLAFVATRRPAWVFIDEPEQNLHPSLQLDFLTTLARYTSRGVMFARIASDLPERSRTRPTPFGACPMIPARCVSSRPRGTSWSLWENSASRVMRSSVSNRYSLSGTF